MLTSWLFQLVVLWFSMVLPRVRSQEAVNLGKLHWCNTLCLCHDDTMEKLHCFKDLEIYNLLEVDTRKVDRLSRAGFELDEKLMWCDETCLCHKAGSRKDFKCTDKVRLGEFINERAPFLVHYLEPEAEKFDARGIIATEDEQMIPEGNAAEGGETPDKKDRHERRKNRKHRRNRKKNHRKQQELELEEPSQEPVTSQTPSEDPITEHENPEVLSAGIFSSGNTNKHDTPSSRHTEEGEGRPNPFLEVPRHRKTVAGEVSNELEDLRNHVSEIKQDVALNQHILLVTVAVAAIAMIGVLILAIYSCCLRRSSKKHSKGPRTTSLRQEENNVTKVNLDEAW